LGTCICSWRIFKTFGCVSEGLILFSDTIKVSMLSVHILGFVQIMHAIVYDRKRQIQSFIPFS